MIYDPTLLDRIPPEVLEAERTLSRWFAEQGAREWRLGDCQNRDDVARPPPPGSEPFERWRKDLRACIVELLYVAHESKSPADCRAHARYGDVMRLVDGGPSLAVIAGGAGEDSLLDDAMAQQILKEAYAEWSQRSGGDDWPLTFARKVLAHVIASDDPALKGGA